MSTVTKKQARNRRVGLLVFLVVLAALIIILCKSCGKEPATQGAIAPISGGTTQTSTPSSAQSAQTSDVPANSSNVKEKYLVAELPSSHTLPVTAILQEPELPTGCEITALTTVLNYLGFSVDKTTIADNYITYGKSGETTFDKAFIGSPYDPTSFGCFAPVIEEAANKYLSQQPGNTYIVEDLTGSTMDDLLYHVASGYPVITWSSINLLETEERYYWTTPDGTDAIWIVNEHCVVLTGYDQTANTVAVCDPLQGAVTYDLTLFTKRYEELKQQAIVIY